MPYILFSLPLNRPLARFDADASTAVSGPGEKIIPCEEGADPDDVERWRAEAAKPAPEPAPGERLAALREAKREEVLAGADAAVARYMAEFSAVERETWPKQQAEVEALAADPQAPTPVLDALAQARGIPRDEQIAKARAKVAAFVPRSCFIVGTQQRYEDQITAIAEDADRPETERIAELEALTFDYALPEGTA